MIRVRGIDQRAPLRGGQARARAFPSFQAPPPTITYTEFLEQTENQEIRKAVFHQHDQRVELTRMTGDQEIVLVPNKGKTMEALVEHGVDVLIGDELETQDISMVLLWMLQFAAFVGIARLLFSNAGGQGPLQRRFLKPKEEAEVKDIGVRFEDIAGAEDAKRDLKEIVDFLQNPDMYARVGAAIPTGVLLYGPSGVGKTILAKGVAGEAGVPFFSCSGSEFIEMFVGVGASRIRSLFEKARTVAPCIVFIDEIDAIGKKRSMDGAGAGGGMSEHDQTINQLLTVMDGFESNDGVIVIGATNRMEVLDEALLRPGRFDRRVYVALPDTAGRRGILQIHTRNKPVEQEVSLDSLARRTVGFSGADLASLCNEAAIYAARAQRTVIQRVDFDRAFEKLTMGEEKRTMYVSEQKKRILSVHEAGHCLVGMLIGYPDPVHKVTIVPRGRAGGATYFEPHPDKDMGLETREALEQHIMVALGGRAAEEIVFGPRFITTGASGDLQNVYQIAYDMIVQYGFSETLGPVSWVEQEGLGADIDFEIKELAERLYEATRDLLFQYRSQLEELAHALYEQETLDRPFLETFTQQVQADRAPRAIHDDI